MPFSSGRMVALMASLAVVSLAGCSSGGGTNDDGAASGVGNGASGAGAPDDELGFSVRYADGPLDVLVNGAWETTAEEVVANIRAQQELLAACMAEQGFEYIPLIPNVEGVTISEGADSGSPAYVEEYGFGINTYVDGPSISFNSSATGENPNDAITGRMSEAELEAYKTAMYGTLERPVEVDEHGGTIEWRTDDGCESRARQRVDPTDEGAIESMEAASEFLHSLYDGSAFDTLNAEWSQCMRQAGYVERSPDSLDKELRGWDGTDFSGPRATPEEEMDAARADLDCRRQTHYDTRYRDLNISQQEEYLAKNPDLAALVNQ